MVLPKNLKGIYAIRFLIGLLESGYFPGLEYLIGSWYSRKELTKRSTFSACSGTAAGPMQQAILDSSWAHKHYQPFQWRFIIDGAISIPFALYTLFVDPSTATATTAFYFSEEDNLSP